MGKINIGYMTEVAYKELATNIEDYSQKFRDNPEDSSWINILADGRVFQEKRFQIDDFQLLEPESPKDTKTLITNSILIYEKLKHLPKYVLSNKYFWLWFMFTRCYSVSLKLMEKQDVSSFKNQWIHPGRRGLFFGVISRCYYRVALTVVDNHAVDRYYLSRFAIERPTRFRELSWRTISSQPHVVRGFLRGIYEVVLEDPLKENTSCYPLLAKDMSRLGSVKLIDVMTEDDIYEYISLKYRKYLGS